MDKITPPQASALWEVTRNQDLVATRDHKADGHSIARGTRGELVGLPENGSAVVVWSAKKADVQATYDARTLPHNVEIRSQTASHKIKQVLDLPGRKQVRRADKSYAQRLADRADKYNARNKGQVQQKEHGREM